MLESGQLETLLGEPVTAAMPNRVGAAIKLVGMTQREVALAIDMSEPHLSNICRGHVKDVSLPTARKLANHFGCQIEDLFPSRAA